MARVTGPSRAELDRRGDEFAARVSRAIRAILHTVALSTRDVDDLARIPTVWRNVVTHTLMPRLHVSWNVAVQGVRVQLEKINADEPATLLAAVFEIPKVSNPLAESFLAEAQNRLVAIGDVVWYTARGEMLTGLELGEGVAELRERVVASASVSRKRAEVIARTEVNSAMNNGAYEQMKALDVTTIKEWIATNDARTRESHAEVDGEEIDGDAKFMVGGFPMDHPHDLNAPPSETINCRCTLAWEIVDDEDDYEDALVASDSFHLPGRHEQKKHGNRKNKSSNVASKKSVKALFADRVAAATRGNDVFTKTPIGTREDLDKATLEKKEAFPGAGYEIEDNKKLNGVDGGDVRAAVADYANNGYQKTNQLLRASEDLPTTRPSLSDPSRRAYDVVTGVDAAMKSSKLTDDVVVYRGIANPRDTFGNAWESMQESATGYSFTDNGYASTTVSEGVARQFAGNGAGIRMNILVPRGTSAVGITQPAGTPLAGERELLLNRGLTYRILNDYEDASGVRTFDVEVVNE